MSVEQLREVEGSVPLGDGREQAMVFRQRLVETGVISSELECLVSVDLAVASPEHMEALETLGKGIHLFLQGCRNLYWSPEFPEHRTNLANGVDPDIVKVWNTKQSKNTPLIFRADTVIDRDGNMQITEVDQMPPCGSGIFSGSRRAFMECVALPPGVENPFPDPYAGIKTLMGSISVKEESGVALVFPRSVDSLAGTMQHVAAALQEDGINAHIVFPDQVDFEGSDAFMTPDDGERTQVTHVLRGYYLHEIKEEAPEKFNGLAHLEEKGIRVTPSPKTEYIHSKYWIATLYNPKYAEFWKDQLGGEDELELMRQVMIPSWIIGEVPPPGLTWFDMRNLSSEKREWVLKDAKPESPSSWGSKGVLAAHRLSTTKWRKLLAHEMEQSILGNELTALQVYVRRAPFNLAVYDNSGQEETIEMALSPRPLYVVHHGQVQLVEYGAVSRHYHEVKQHGATDSLFRPMMVSSNGE